MLKVEKHAVRNYNFEQQLISFIQRKKVAFNFEFRKLIYPPYGNFFVFRNGKKLSFNKKPSDVAIGKEDYFRICIAHSITINESTDFLDKNEIQIIHCYNTVYKYNDILLKEYVIEDAKGNKLLPKDSDFKFNVNHSIELLSVFKTLLDNDKTL